MKPNVDGRFMDDLTINGKATIEYTLMISVKSEHKKWVDNGVGVAGA
jgi:hypothetical protein